MTPEEFYKRAAEQLAKKLTGEECTVELTETSLLPESCQVSVGPQYVGQQALAKQGPDPEGAARFELLLPTTTTPTPSKSRTPTGQQ
jgi:hypothetical protein